MRVATLPWRTPPHEGRPKSATDDENVAAVKAAIEDDGRVSLEKLEETLGIDATSNWRVLTKDLSLKFSKLYKLQLFTWISKEYRSGIQFILQKVF